MRALALAPLLFSAVALAAQPFPAVAADAGFFGTETVTGTLNAPGGIDAGAVNATSLTVNGSPISGGVSNPLNVGTLGTTTAGRATLDLNASDGTNAFEAQMILDDGGVLVLGRTAAAHLSFPYASSVVDFVNGPTATNASVYPSGLFVADGGGDFCIRGGPCLSDAGANANALNVGVPGTTTAGRATLNLNASDGTNAFQAKLVLDDGGALTLLPPGAVVVDGGVVANTLELFGSGIAGDHAAPLFLNEAANASLYASILATDAGALHTYAPVLADVQIGGVLAESCSTAYGEGYCGNANGAPYIAVNEFDGGPAAPQGVGKGGVLPCANSSTNYFSSFLHPFTIVGVCVCSLTTAGEAYCNVVDGGSQLEYACSAIASVNYVCVGQ